MRDRGRRVILEAASTLLYALGHEGGLLPSRDSKSWLGGSIDALSVACGAISNDDIGRRYII